MSHNANANANAGSSSNQGPTFTAGTPGVAGSPSTTPLTESNLAAFNAANVTTIKPTLLKWLQDKDDGLLQAGMYRAPQGWEELKKKDKLAADIKAAQPGKRGE